MSIPEVARACDLTDSTVRSIIDRKQKRIALNIAFKLSSGLGVPLERLNGEPPINEKAPAPKNPEADARLQEIISCYHAMNEQGKNFLLTQTRMMAQSKEFVSEEAESKNA